MFSFKTALAGAAAVALTTGLAACGSQPHSAASAPEAAATQTAGGCSQINSALNSVFNGDYAGLPPAKTTGDLLNNFLGQSTPVTSALASIMAEHETAPGLKSAESRLNADVNKLDNTSYVTSAQSAVIVPDLKAISDICGPATWTHVTLEGATGTPNGAPTTAPATTAPAAPAAPHVVKTTTVVVFRVTGSGEPSIEYGSDTDTVNVPGGLGTLGDGVALPFTATLPVNDSALYYVTTAQLEDGGGSITDTVSMRVTLTYSNGTHKSSSKVLATGHASGNYAIASAQFNNN